MVFCSYRLPSLRPLRGPFLCWLSAVSMLLHIYCTRLEQFIYERCIEITLYVIVPYSFLCHLPSSIVIDIRLLLCLFHLLIISFAFYLCVAFISINAYLDVCHCALATSSERKKKKKEQEEDAKWKMIEKPWALR